LKHLTRMSGRYYRRMHALRLGAYRLFAKHLPQATAPGGRLWRRIRCFIAAPLLASAGHGVNIEHGAEFGGSVSLGDRSGIGVDCRIYGPAHIGRDVMMGRDVVIVAMNHNFDDLDRPMIDQGHQPPKLVTIGDDVWIGDRVLIVPGVTVGNGAILALGAVITKDVPPGAIVGGNPARLLRYRSDQRRAGPIIPSAPR
jgi:maltose O-acetyltransferase